MRIQETHTKKTHILKKIGLLFSDVVTTSHSIVNIIGRPTNLVKKSTYIAFFITLFKYKEMWVLIQFRVMLHCEFAKLQYKFQCVNKLVEIEGWGLRFPTKLHQITPTYLHGENHQHIVISEAPTIQWEWWAIIGCWMNCSQRTRTNVQGDFWAWPVDILVFPSPTDYMLTSFGFCLSNWGTFYKLL